MDLCHQHTLLQTLRRRDTFHQYSDLHQAVGNILQRGQQKCFSRSVPVRYVSRNLRFPHLNRISPLQHVSLEVQNPYDDKYKVMEKVAFPSVRDDGILNHWEDTVIIQLPDTCFSYEDVLAEHERTVFTKYILGLNDCRHHALNLLTFCYGI